MLRHPISRAAALLTLLAPLLASAGQSCEEAPLTPKIVRQAMAMAQNVTATLDKRGANVAFDDHPNELRYSDRIRTVTVDSITQFLTDRNEGWEIVEIPAPRHEWTGR